MAKCDSTANLSRRQQHNDGAILDWMIATPHRRLTDGLASLTVHPHLHKALLIGHLVLDSARQAVTLAEVCCLSYTIYHWLSGSESARQSFTLAEIC